MISDRVAFVLQHLTKPKQVIGVCCDLQCILWMQDVASEENRGEQIKLMREGYWELFGKEIKGSDVVSGLRENHLVEKAMWTMAVSSRCLDT